MLSAHRGGASSAMRRARPQRSTKRYSLPNDQLWPGEAPRSGSQFSGSGRMSRSSSAAHTAESWQLYIWRLSLLVAKYTSTTQSLEMIDTVLRVDSLEPYGNPFCLEYSHPGTRRPTL